MAQRTREGGIYQEHHFDALGDGVFFGALVIILGFKGVMRRQRNANYGCCAIMGWERLMMDDGKVKGGMDGINAVVERHYLAMQRLGCVSMRVG